MNIYLDMDDVVADWTGYANQFFNTPGRLAQHYLPDEQWLQLKTQQRMYRELEPKAGAYTLVNLCLDYTNKHGGRVAFLTALPHDDSFPYASYDKVMWANKYFPDMVVFFGPYAKDKHNFCKPGDLLVDDRLSNCDDWCHVGGKAVVYTTWKDSEPLIRTQLK